MSVVIVRQAGHVHVHVRCHSAMLIFHFEADGALALLLAPLQLAHPRVRGRVADGVLRGGGLRRRQLRPRRAKLGVRRRWSVIRTTELRANRLPVHQQPVCSQLLLLPLLLYSPSALP